MVSGRFGPVLFAPGFAPSSLARLWPCPPLALPAPSPVRPSFARLWPCPLLVLFALALLAPGRLSNYSRPEERRNLQIAQAPLALALSS
jgi:hypothetical protein